MSRSIDFFHSLSSANEGCSSQNCRHTGTQSHRTHPDDRARAPALSQDLQRLKAPFSTSALTRQGTRHLGPEPPDYTVTDE